MAEITVTPVEDIDNFEEWKDKFNELLSDVTNVNSEVKITSPITLQFSYDEDATTGLDFHYREGYLLKFSVATQILSGFVTLADDAVNIVYLNYLDGFEGIESAISGAEPAEDIIPLYLVTTASGEITNIADYRTMYLAQQSGTGIPIEEFFPSAGGGQDVFNLPFTTQYGVAVYVDGSRLAQGALPADYQITGDTQIQLNSPLAGGESVLVVARDLDGDFNFDPIEEIQVAGIGGQQIFTLAVVPVSNKVAVYWQGVRQFSYTYNTSTSEITLNEVIPEGDEVLFVVNDSAGGRRGLPNEVDEGKVLVSKGSNTYEFEPWKSDNYVPNGYSVIAKGEPVQLTSFLTQGEVDGHRAFTTEITPGGIGVNIQYDDDFNDGGFHPTVGRLNGNQYLNTSTGSWYRKYFRKFDPPFDSIKTSNVDTLNEAVWERLEKFPIKYAASTTLSDSFVVNRKGHNGYDDDIFKAIYQSPSGISSNVDDSSQSVDIIVPRQKIVDNFPVEGGDSISFAYKGTFNVGETLTMEYFPDGGGPSTPLAQNVDFNIIANDGIQLIPTINGGVFNTFPTDGYVHVENTSPNKKVLTQGVIGLFARTRQSDANNQGGLQDDLGYYALCHIDTGANTIRLTISYTGTLGVGNTIADDTFNYNFNDVGVFERETAFRLDFVVVNDTLNATVSELDPNTDFTTDLGIIGIVGGIDGRRTSGYSGFIHKEGPWIINNWTYNVISTDSKGKLEQNNINCPVMDNYSFDALEYNPTSIDQGKDTANFKFSSRIYGYGSNNPNNIYSIFDADVKGLKLIEGKPYYIRATVFHTLGEDVDVRIGLRTWDVDYNTLITDEATYLANTTLHDNDIITVQSGVPTVLELFGIAPVFTDFGFRRKPMVEFFIPHSGAVQGDIEIGEVEMRQGDYVFSKSEPDVETISLDDSRNIGDIVIKRLDNTDRGYVRCDGREINRTKYQALFAKWGTSYGSGNGTTTFNVIDFQIPGVEGSFFFDNGIGYFVRAL